MRIVGGFDWTITAKGDLHFIHQVKDLDSNVTVNAHTYKPAGATEFITTTDFPAAGNIYSAGDDIYIIGLDGSRPYVEIAEGGTNNFERIYHGTTGNFQRGEVYIDNGKIYFYLMERASGAQRPTYLQIIDLGLNKANVTFESEQITVGEGYQNLSITATPSINDPASSIASVALYIDGALVSTLNTAPYEWTQVAPALQNLPLGSYELRALVTDNNGETAEAFTTLNVVDATPSISFAQAAQTQTEGYTSLNIGVNASTPIPDRSVAGVTLLIDNAEVSSQTSAPYQWTQAEAALQALAVGSYTLSAVVTDSEGASAETTQTLTISEDTTPPTVSFGQSSMSKTVGYSDIAINVSSNTSNAVSSIASVALYINGTLVSTEATASHQWTQSSPQLMGLAAGTHTARAVATDTKGLQSEATMTITVNAQSTSGGSGNGASSGGGGGGAISPLSTFALALFAMIALRRKAAILKR